MDARDGSRGGVGRPAHLGGAEFFDAAIQYGAGIECSVEASYLEIYMEQLRDLLNPGTLRGRAAQK